MNRFPNKGIIHAHTIVYTCHIYSCLYIRIQISKWTHIYEQVSQQRHLTCTYIYTHTYKCIHMYIFLFIYIHTNLSINTYLWTGIPTKASYVHGVKIPLSEEARDAIAALKSDAPFSYVQVAFEWISEYFPNAYAHAHTRTQIYTHTRLVTHAQIHT